MSNDLVILSADKVTPLTTSEIIAKALNKDHKDVLALAKRYKNELEAFGHASFQTNHVKRGFGTKEQDKEIALLNEPQATFLITLMRNSPEVVKFKVALVKAFYLMRERINNERINELQKINNNNKSKNAKLQRELNAMVEKNKKLQNDLETSKKVKGTLSTKEQYEISQLVQETANRLGVATANIYKRIYDIFQVPSYKLLSSHDVELLKKQLSEMTEAPADLPKSKHVERIYKFTRPIRNFFSELDRLNNDKDLYNLMECVGLIESLTDTAVDSKRLMSMRDYLVRLQTMFAKNRMYISFLHNCFPLRDNSAGAPYARIVV